MSTLLIAVGAFVGYLIAYHTYGRWISRKIFQLDDSNVVPSHELRDDVDFVPTKRQIIFGHHFTSIAGTGPIVGPAITVAASITRMPSSAFFLVMCFSRGNGVF